MKVNDCVEVEDKLLKRMIEAKEKAAVLKHRLVEARSEIPDTIIFVFEGDEDKIVYFNWVRRIEAGLDYEPFVCRGKKKVLQLREVVMRDRANLAEGIYFFVDRDFDDLGKYDPRDNTFMTDRYSVENYLVDVGVLREFLKNEFHCHAKPKARGPIVEHFETLYESFLTVTREVNFRIFVARKTGINAPGLPDRINSVVNIDISEVKMIEASLADIIKLEREPTPEEDSRWADEFANLVPSDRYRGKFALKFFEKWLDLLARDYAEADTTFFKEIDRTAKVKRSEITIGSMASKSRVPELLPQFLRQVSPPSPNKNDGT